MTRAERRGGALKSLDRVPEASQPLDKLGKDLFRATRRCAVGPKPSRNPLKKSQNSAHDDIPAAPRPRTLLFGLYVQTSTGISMYLAPETCARSSSVLSFSIFRWAVTIVRS